jgi:FkbM family methyltransferase
MTSSRSDLIFDIGSYDGEDTAYYLFRGYNVVAVDANPLMIEKTRQRFAREVGANRLTLLNVGISATPGMAEFWISDCPEWSSFDRGIASRNGTAHQSISIPTVPFAQLLEEHGVPHYLKIDIEGSDGLCVTALNRTNLPRFISVEAECIGDAAGLSEAEAVTNLELLRDAGYRRFKLVNQNYGWTSVRSSPVSHFCVRALTSVARGRFRVRGLSTIADRFTDLGRIGALGFAFAPGSSGPWGDDIPGAWMTINQARTAYLRERHSFFSKQQPSFAFWNDWHATY